MGIIIKKYKIMEPKRKNWTVPAIVAIAFFVFGWIAWAISEYRPTAKGQIAWEWVAGFSFFAFVVMCGIAYIAGNRKND
jgi:hypothetical protein